MTLTSTSAALLFLRAFVLETILRRRQLAFHHVELLSQTAFSGEPTPTHGFSRSARRDPPPLQFCGGRVRGDAGACASAGRRAGKGNTVDSDASPGEPEKGTPSTVMQVLKQRFADSVLRARRRRSPSQALLWEQEAQHIWQARFYDFNVWSQRKRGRSCVICMG